MTIGNMLSPEFFDAWIAALWQASWQGAIAIGAVWAVCRCVPRLPPNLRCWLWRLALLKMVLAAIPWGSVDVPLLPSSWAAQQPRDCPILRVSETGTVPSGARVENELDTREIPQGRAALFAVWMAVVTVFLAMLVIRARGARRWRQEWRLIKDGEILGLNELLSVELGLFQPPVLFEAETCPSPVVFGAVRTSIVLPSPLLAQSSPSQLRMILAHEMAHIRRGDLLGNWFSTFISGMFFFHPLVWLAIRESRLAQEVACDELVSRQRGVSVADYGLLLLELATKYPRSAIPLATVGVVESFDLLFKRRLNAMRYFGENGTNRPKSWGILAASWVLVTISVLGLLPWRLVAQSVTCVAEPAIEIPQKAASHVPDAPWQLSEKGQNSPFIKVEESPFRKIEESPFQKVEESPFQKVEESPFKPYDPAKAESNPLPPNNSIIP